MERYDARTLAVGKVLLVLASVIMLALLTVQFGPSLHPGEVAACSGAFAIGLGGHLIVDVLGYVAVFLVGTKARKWWGACTHHSHKHPRC